MYQLISTYVKDEINKVYEEAAKAGNIEKQGGLGDSKVAHETIPGSGPNVEGLQEPVEGAVGDESGEVTVYLNKISQRINKKAKKPGKTVKEGINIDMKNNGSNIFDKLYSVIMEDEELPDEFDLGGDEGGDEEIGDDLGDDMGGDEVSFSLPRDVAEQLSDALAAALGGGDDMEDDMGDDIEDFGDEEDDMGELDEMSFREGVNLGTVKTEGNPKAQPDGVPGHTNVSSAHKTKGKNNNVKSGKANTGTIKTDGDPKPLPDGVSKMQSKNPKVGAKEHHIGD